MTNCSANGFEDKELFDSTILQDLDFSKCLATYKPQISQLNPGENLIMRALRISDYDKGYIELLKQLTVVGDLSREKYEDRFNKMAACRDGYFIIVVEDKTTNLVIGSATLAVEQKFIHECSSKGRVEDVVVDDKYRGKQLGKLLIDVLMMLSIKVGCYKISLECKDKMVPFYEQFGYVKEEGQNYMCKRF